MLCALFSGFFLLATRKESDIHFEVVAIISLDEVQIEKADDGRGKSPPPPGFIYS